MVLNCIISNAGIAQLKLEPLTLEFLKPVEISFDINSFQFCSIRISSVWLQPELLFKTSECVNLFRPFYLLLMNMGLVETSNKIKLEQTRI